MTKDLTRGTPWKLIVQFALPIMAGNLLQQLYNTADTIIVGNFNGQQALSAVGACASLTVLFTALAIGFSIGAGVLISQYFGASREQERRLQREIPACARARHAGGAAAADAAVFPHLRRGPRVPVRV